MLHTRAHANPTNARPKQRGMLACIVALVAGMACTATAQESTFEWPEPNAALVELVGAPYLTDDERRQLKVRHGMDDPADLTSPALKARAALGRGAFTDPALQDPAADPLDRADALLVLGDLRGALDLVKGGDSFRALRIAAQAHLDLGEIADAERTLSAALAKLQAARPAEAAELVEAVAALSLLTRVPDFTAREGRNADTDFRALMQLLGDARRLDRFDADAPLSEAAILFEKDNLPEAIQSLTAALSLFPRSARAWALFGAVTCRQFDFKKALEVAQRLDNIAGTENSLFGSLLAAKVRLRQTDPEGAEEVLATAYAAHPMQREVLALRAAAAAAGFKNDLARERLREFDSRFPGSPTALLEIGLALSDRRQYAEAAEYLRKAIERAPAWPEAWTELGLLEVQACNDDSARDVLKTAQKLDPFNTRAANSLKLVTEMAEYTRLESPHFTVRYKPGVDEVLAREMPAILEKIHARVAGNGRGGINFEPERKTTVDLMPDHAWFSVRITGMPAVHTIAASTGPGIAMEAPRSGSGASMGPYDWARVVQHEYTHTVSLARTRNRLPHWFTEAAAVYLEDAPRDDDRCTLLHRAFETDTLFDFDEINIAFVRPAKPSDRGLAYAQGHWMYEFMIERLGADVPLRLMDRYAAGDSEAQAFQSVMGMSREDFLDRFRSYARESLVSWGLTPPKACPTCGHCSRPRPATTVNAPSPRRKWSTAGSRSIQTTPRCCP